MLQAIVDDDHHQHHQQQQVVVLLWAADGNAEDRRRGAELEIADSHRIDQGDALRTVGDVDRCVQVVHENAHDFAEAEGDDGQIIPTQLERGRTEEHAKDAGNDPAQREDDPERQVQPEMRAGQQSIEVGTDRIEGDVAEIEQTGKADDDVETQCQKDIENRKIDDAHPGLSAKGCDKRQAEQGNGNEQITERLAHRKRADPRTHARSPVFSPKRPDGRNISTKISTTKAKMS